MAVNALDMMARATGHQRGLSRVVCTGRCRNGVDVYLAELSLNVFCSDIAIVAGITVGFLDAGIE